MSIVYKMINKKIRASLRSILQFDLSAACRKEKKGVAFAWPDGSLSDGSIMFPINRQNSN